MRLASGCNQLGDELGTGLEIGDPAWLAGRAFHATMAGEPGEKHWRVQMPAHGTADCMQLVGAVQRL